MTNGSSQGLFVIVAVVIFGILVAVSYSLFRGTLQPALAGVFKVSTQNVFSEFVPYTNVKNVYNIGSKVKTLGEGHYLKYEFNQGGNNVYPAGFRIMDYIEIPWGHRLEFSYEVKFEGSTNLLASTDLNAYPLDKFTEGAWKGNDNYGSRSFKEGYEMYRIKELKPNVWNTVNIWYANDNELNKDKETLTDGSTLHEFSGTVLGVQLNSINLNKVKEFEMKNIKYRVVKMEGVYD